MAATRCRSLKNLLKFKPKSREKRKRLYKNLVTALVQYERVETTINRCHDLSRVAERVSPCKIASKWICMGNSMICSDIWHKYHEWYFEIVIRNLRQLRNITSGIYAKYHVQIMLLFVYTTTLKRFVIFTCRYFKLSWNTTSLSQSNCRNFSCSSINVSNSAWCGIDILYYSLL